MSARMNHRQTSGLLSTIAFAPIPPETHAYVFRTDAPPASARSVQRSPYAATLRHVYDERTRTLYVAPTETPVLPPGFTTANLPAWYRPDTDYALPPAVPIPVQPVAPKVPQTTSEIIRTEAENPSGLFFRLPKGTNSHYYLSKFSGLEIVQRQKQCYARFHTSDPREPQLPAALYQDPPPAATRRTPEAVKREPIPHTGTVHVYLRAHTPKKYVPHSLRHNVRQDYYSHSVHDRYFPVSVHTLNESAPDSHLILLLATYASHIYYHPDMDPADLRDPLLPPSFHNVKPEPLPQPPQD